MIKDFKSSINLDYKISPIIYNDLEDSNSQAENTKQNITIDDDIDSWKPMFNIRKEVADFIAMNSKSFNINHNNIFGDLWEVENVKDSGTHNFDFDFGSDYEKLRFEYIKALENPNLIGYDKQNDRWTSPTGRGYDSNGIGIGLDKYTNSYVRSYLSTHNKDWLSMDEMLQLQNKSFEWAENVLNRNTKGLKMSNAKRVIALGIIYHGHGPKLWKKQHSLHQALFNGSDKEFIDAVTKFYSGNSRSSRHKNFWK